MNTLHEDQYTFLIISLSFFLRMRNVSDKRCGENETRFMFMKFFPENRAVYEIIWNIWYSETDLRWQYITVHALCLLDT